MGTSYSKQLEKTYLDLTITSKHMQRQSKKQEQQSAKSRKLVQQYMKKNEMEVAKIHAENSIRNKNESVNYLRLSARLDAVAQRVKSALAQNDMSKNMKQVVSSLDGVLESMNAEKIAETMEKFESNFDTLDVRTKFMDSTIANATATSTPQEDVTSLMNQVGEHIGIQVSEELDASGVPVTIDKNAQRIEERTAVAESETTGGKSSNDDQPSSGGGSGTAGSGGVNFADLEARFNNLSKK